MNEWAAQGCKLDDTPRADEVTTAPEERSDEEWLMRAVCVISLFGGVLLVMLAFFVLMIACFQSLDFNSTTMHMLLALTGLTAAFISIDALLLLRMALALTPAWIATPPADGNALPESGRLGRLWSRMNLLLRTVARALASSSTSTRASTHAVVRRPVQAHAPQPLPPQLNEIAIPIVL